MNHETAMKAIDPHGVMTNAEVQAFRLGYEAASTENARLASRIAELEAFNQSHHFAAGSL